MIEIIGGSLAILTYLYTKELFHGKSEKDIISSNLPDCTFIKEQKEDDYTLYLYRASYGVDYKIDKITNRIQGHLGKYKFVKVEFDKLMKVYVYHKELPKKALLPIFEEKDNSRVAIGIGHEGIVYHNFKQFPHMVIAGTTGYGKSNFIRSLIPQLDGEIVLLDLKKSGEYEFVSAEDIAQAVEVLNDIENVFYLPKQKPIFVIVDEAQELVAPDYLTKKDEKAPYQYCQRIMALIGAQGRSNQVHLIYATQYPTSEVIPRFVKQNAETRVVFRIPTEVGSRVALDEQGAEKLPRKQWGRALYKTDRIEEIQTFFVKEVDKVVTKVRTTEKTRDRDIIEIGEGEYYDGGTADENQRRESRGEQQKKRATSVSGDGSGRIH